MRAPVGKKRAASIGSAFRFKPDSRVRWLFDPHRFERRDRIVYPLGYHPSLDGLRGVMTLGVLTAHIQLVWYPGAILFMDTFFIMSAYLITALLMKDWQRDGRLNLRRFFVRRIRRLFPAFYAMLIVFTLVAWLILPDWTSHLPQVLVAGLYVSNWTRAFNVEMPAWLGHTWSLSIEEQFYLLWPLILIGLLKGFGLNRRTVLVVLLLAAAFAAWRAYLTTIGAPHWRLYNGTDTRADALLIGCALGIAFQLREIRENPAIQRLCAALAGPIVIAFFALGFWVQWEWRWPYLWGNVMFSLASVTLIAALIGPHRTWVHALFEIAPAVFLGRICYGLYLWHFPIYNVLRLHYGFGNDGLIFIGVPLTFAFAIASYYLIERPLLRRKG
jgi:peptidoglycan/LPS O-acetylase OafA/YrhL